MADDQGVAGGRASGRSGLMTPKQYERVRELFFFAMADFRVGVFGRVGMRSGRRVRRSVAVAGRRDVAPGSDHLRACAKRIDIGRVQTGPAFTQA